MMHVWKSDDSLWEVVLSFHSVGSRHQAKAGQQVPLIPELFLLSTGETCDVVYNQP